jgi:hypothetical protein
MVIGPFVWMAVSVAATFGEQGLRGCKGSLLDNRAPADSDDDRAPLVDDGDVVKRLESRSPIHFSRKRQDLRPFSTQFDRGSADARRPLFAPRDSGQCSVPPPDHLVWGGVNP